MRTALIGSLTRLKVIMGALFFHVLLSAQSLSYTVSWLAVPVVDITIQTTHSDTSMHGTYHARTRPWFDKLYSVDNRYDIWTTSPSGLPLRYEKIILERNRDTHFWAQYEEDGQRVVYANSLERPWQAGMHTLFSALLWVQHHPWEEDERQDLLVEVEGVIWQVTTRCTQIDPSTGELGARAEVLVRFEGQEYGEPVLSRTDMVTYMLPGKGHQLKFSLDLDRHQIRWVTFGSIPFQVRAELNPIP